MGLGLGTSDLKQKKGRAGKRAHEELAERAKHRPFNTCGAFSSRLPAPPPSSFETFSRKTLADAMKAMKRLKRMWECKER